MGQERISENLEAAGIGLAAGAGEGIHRRTDF